MPHMPLMPLTPLESTPAMAPAAPADHRRRRMLMACALGVTVGCAARHGPASLETRKRGAGSGRPLVVFQSGLGDGLAVWEATQSALPAAIGSVALSRPGYGASAWVDGPRSSCDVARLSREFLRQAGLAPPYVLVGHSPGGLYQFAWARQAPGEVAGLVLLDPTHPRHWATLQHEVPALAATVKLARMTAFSTAMRREFDDQALCNAELEAAHHAPGMPVRLLVRERFTGLESGAFERAVHGLEEDRARRLGGAAVTRVPGAGHYLQRDRPQAVAAAIAEVVAEVVAAAR